METDTRPIGTPADTQQDRAPRPRRDRLCDATEFPVVQSCTYLSICDSTALSHRVRGAVDEFLDHVMYWREARTVRELRVEGARDKFARLIGAESGRHCDREERVRGHQRHRDRAAMAPRRQRRPVCGTRTPQQRPAVAAPASARRRNARRRAGRWRDRHRSDRHRDRPANARRHVLVGDLCPRLARQPRADWTRPVAARTSSSWSMQCNRRGSSRWTSCAITSTRW